MHVFQLIEMRFIQHILYMIMKGREKKSHQRKYLNLIFTERVA